MNEHIYVSLQMYKNKNKLMLVQKIYKAHPICPFKLTIERGSSVTSKAWSKCIDDHQGSKKSSTIVGVEYPNQRKNKNKNRAAMKAKKVGVTWIKVHIL